MLIVGQREASVRVSHRQEQVREHARDIDGSDASRGHIPLEGHTRAFDGLTRRIADDARVDGYRVLELYQRLLPRQQLEEVAEVLRAGDQGDGLKGVIDQQCEREATRIPGHGLRDCAGVLH